MNKPVDNHRQIVGNSVSILSMFVPSFSGVIVVMSSDVVNPTFRITLMIFFKTLPRDLCDGLELVTAGIN